MESIHTQAHCEVWPLRAALEWAPAPHSPIPPCQVYKAFVILENEMMIPWDCIQGLTGTPNHNDHNLPKLGL